MHSKRTSQLFDCAGILIVILLVFGTGSIGVLADDSAHQSPENAQPVEEKQLTESEVMAKDDPRAIWAKLEQSECSKLPYLNEARWNLYTGEYESALKLASQAIKEHPDCAHAYETRAAAWRGLHQLKKAIADIEKGTSLCPNCGGMWFMASTYHEDAKQFQRAINDLTQSMEVGLRMRNMLVDAQRPKFHSTSSELIDRARNYIKLGNYFSAIQDLDSWLNSGHETAEARYLHGVAYEHQHLREKAIREYKQTITDIRNIDCPMYRNALSALKRLGVEPKSIPTLPRPRS